MIFIRLSGGLGNQMFQYALGRVLALKHNTTLKLDLEAYECNSGREYALDCFALKVEFADPQEVKGIKEIPLTTYQKILRVLTRRPLSVDSMRVIWEKQYNFDAAILDLPDDVYLVGYWQSEKYFKEITELIRKDFTFKYPPTAANLKMAEIIKKLSSVSLHVRRGDYVTDAKIRQVHGVCSLDYYRKAVTKITQKVANPTFFVFSDDPEWVKAGIRLEFPTYYVDHNQRDNAYEDMRLMSLCRHHIIANSSFSWWGAWLNPNPKKLVVAPKRWFKDSTINTHDLIPSSWVRV